MTYFLRTEADLQLGLAQLILADPRLKPVADKAGTFALRRREPGFSGLCAIVCGQQLSTASAAAIRARLFAAFDPFHHDTVRRARTEKLKRLGLSAPKIKSIREIGKAVAKGNIDLTAVGNMGADEAHATLDLTSRGGPVDRRHLSAVLSRPRGRVSCRRSGGPGVCPYRTQLTKASRRKSAREIGRGVASMARRGSASPMGLLSRGKET